MNKIATLAKIANRLDSIGLTKEADIIDSLIRKIAKDPYEVAGFDAGYAGAGLTGGAMAGATAASSVANTAAVLATPVAELAGAFTPAAVGAQPALAAAVGGGMIAAVLGAGLVGIGYGTLINKGLKATGINDAVIDWYLARKVSKEGIDFSATLDSNLAKNIVDKNGKSIRPVSFTVTGVQGILIDPNTNTVIDNNDSYGFSAVSPVPFNGNIKTRMPNKQGGIFIPARLIGQLTFENGQNFSIISKEGSMVTTPGTSLVRAVLTNSKALTSPKMPGPSKPPDTKPNKF